MPNIVTALAFPPPASESKSDPRLIANCANLTIMEPKQILSFWICQPDFFDYFCIINEKVCIFFSKKRCTPICAMKIRYSLLIIFTILLFSCSSPERKILAHADSVMEEFPDSAMTILNGIDRSGLNDRDLAYYALLYTQAQVKTNVPLTSDSLISIAYAKYGDDIRGDKGIRSNFYTGEVFFNKEKYRDAMKYYLTAYEESKRLGNDYWRAKSAERIGEIFFNVYSYDEAENYAKEAAEFFKKANREINHRYALGELAIIWVNNCKEEDSYHLLDSLYSISNMANGIDCAFINYITPPLIASKIAIGKTDVDENINSDFDKDNMTAGEVIDDAVLQSQIYNLSEDAGKGQSVLDSVTSLAKSNEDKLHLLYAKYENAKTQGKNILALSLVDSLLLYQDSVTASIIKGYVTDVKSDFYSEKALIHMKRSKSFRTLLIASGMFFILIIVSVSFLYYYRQKAQKVKIETIMESFIAMKKYSDRVSNDYKVLEKSINEKIILINKLKKSVEEHQQIVNALNKIVEERVSTTNELNLLLEEKNKALSNLKMIIEENKFEVAKLQKDVDENKSRERNYKEIVERLFKEKWNTLDMLCSQYFSLNNSELTEKNIITNTEIEISKIVSKKGLSEIVKAVDIYMEGIITRLRSQCLFLKDTDICFLALIYAGFSARAICLFADIQYKNFYVKKSRLLKRIKDSNVPDKELFMSKIN